MRQVGGAHPNQLGSPGSALFNPVLRSAEDCRQERCVHKLRVTRFTMIAGCLSVPRVAMSSLKITLKTVIELGSQARFVSGWNLGEGQPSQSHCVCAIEPPWCSFAEDFNKDAGFFLQTVTVEGDNSIS